MKAIDQDSQQLAKALVDGTMIVITTLQKFPFVLKGLLTLAGGGPVGEPLGVRTAPRRPSGSARSPDGATPSSSTRRTPARRARPRAR